MQGTDTGEVCLISQYGNQNRLKEAEGRQPEESTGHCAHF